MAFDIFSERRLSITAAAKRLDIHTSTVWRWVLRGCRDVRLESALIGGKRFTSEEALSRFVARINGIPEGQQNIPTVPQRKRAIKSAHDYLVSEGL